METCSRTQTDDVRYSVDEKDEKRSTALFGETTNYERTEARNRFRHNFAVGLSTETQGTYANPNAHRIIDGR